MISTVILFAVLALGAIGWSSARGRARLLYTGRDSMHSMPVYHAWHTALWILLPSLLILALWSSVSPMLVDSAVLSAPVAASIPDDAMQRMAILSEARVIAHDPQFVGFYEQSVALAEPMRAAETRYALMGALMAAVAAFTGGGYAFTRVRSAFPARTRVERGVMLLLLGASLLAILITFGIIGSLVFEAARFFN